MKNFFKYVTASCFGTFLAFGLIFLVLMMIGLSSAPKDSVTSGSTLHIKLDVPVSELTDNVEAAGFTFESISHLGLNEITKAIVNAANDSRISSILIETEFPNIGQSTALSIYNAIDSFRVSGKPVLAYGEYFSQTGYLLASVADTVVLNPNGMMDIRGFGMLIPYFGDMIEKIDAKVDVYYAGQFKSAIEPYYRSNSSPQNDLQSQEFLDDWQDEWLDNILKYRKIDRNQIHKIINDGTIVTAEVAEQFGLADKLMYWRDFKTMLENILDRKPKLLELDKYIDVADLKIRSSSNKIAVVYLEGTILNNSDDKGVISMGRYEKVFDRLMKKSDVKAVVLRVNSGGGDALESDIIWDRVEQLKSAGKYVVASFGDYAASGGYYISCGADKIVTQPNTLTGSIGVFSMIPDLSATFSNNLGINFDSIGTGANTFMYSPMVPRNANQNRKIQATTEATYQKFLGRVAEGRKMSKEAVHEIAQGRVWSGTDAVNVGLADAVGDINLAIEMAAEGAGYEGYKILQYPVIEKTFYEEILEGLMEVENIKMVFGIKKQNDLEKKFAGVVKLLSKHNIGQPQCRLPFIIIEK